MDMAAGARIAALPRAPSTAPFPCVLGRVRPPRCSALPPLVAPADSPRMADVPARACTANAPRPPPAAAAIGVALRRGVADERVAQLVAVSM